MEVKLTGGFIAVPCNCVCRWFGNRITLTNAERSAYVADWPRSVGSWCIIAPDGYAIDDHDNKPYYYGTLEEAEKDAKRLSQMEEYSTCKPARKS